MTNSFLPSYDTPTTSGRKSSRRLLTFALLDLPEHELPQGGIGQSQQRCFFEGAVRLPAIHQRAFHEPHPGGSSTARSMYKRGRHARGPDHLEKRVDRGGIGTARAERDVDVLNARKFGCRRVGLDVGA